MSDKRHGGFWLGWIVLAGMLCFAGGVYASRSAEETDMEWAKAAGIWREEVAKTDKLIPQARFLQMVMTIYAPQENGLFVPPGAENHWAASIYATAKKEGLIDCSCQIKPDEPLTVEEAAKFVMRGINRKAVAQVVTMDEVMGWVGRDAKAKMTNQDAVKMVRGMDEVFQEKNLKK